MSRRKKADADPPDDPVPAEEPGHLTAADPAPLPLPTDPPDEPPSPPDPDRPRPVASWCVPSDRGTLIELNCWPNVYRTADGQEFERLSFTLKRSYRDADGRWRTQKTPSWRTHDVPVVLHLLAKAHAFALDRRSSPDVPF